MKAWVDEKYQPPGLDYLWFTNGREAIKLLTRYYRLADKGVKIEDPIEIIDIDRKIKNGQDIIEFIQKSGKGWPMWLYHHS